MSTDDDWEWYGRENPYFGVLTDDRYRYGQMSDALKDEFFFSGQVDVDRILSPFGRNVAALQSMEKALDFGCGVGRLAIPLARRFNSVVGVDVSESMLGEAKRNAQLLQAENLRWCKSLSELAAESNSFSFVNTLIVLQHIEPERGLGFIKAMISLVGSGGGGAIQLIYGRAQDHHNLGQAKLTTGGFSSVRKLYLAARRRLMRLPPSMQMNPYPMNKIMFLLQTSGLTHFFTEFTDHGGYLGVTIYFTKP